ncbi:mitochondrial aconitate hydratase [Naegleria gruberi]|uniref:Aconitate hydratase, mitochondrial n=1 Tax=Naegleria gruberi TaxID=5762 RepID=D2V0H0_NAEGR|nr:mitochondrial aconitate hydratase [Naegleria gruberi]EFC49719.1 mitochondrial aconitate hydratase [Naegleria gruberi]|eukprot:XP_002682463.1 mitochondrial aconitate hydratase [Naegleria gruberi strain NEG-M]
MLMNKTNSRKLVGNLKKVNKCFVTSQTCRKFTSLPPQSDIEYTTQQQAKIYERMKSGKDKLTYAQKILQSHLFNESETLQSVKESYLNFKPDRVALQDASAQTAILQFMITGMDKTAVPTSVHCDHLIVGEGSLDIKSDKPTLAKRDVEKAFQESGEVFNFLESSSQRYGIGFWKPGSGIIHQIVLENYAFPGGMMIGCDSHTPNGGGLGMVAIGVGGADAVDVMSGIPWELKRPKILGVKLTGKLNEWASAKDVILKLAGKLTVKGGTGYIIEYFGEGVESLSCTGMATICNMGAEVGATCSIFPYTQAMSRYLRATNRGKIAENADRYAQVLKADEGAKYDEIIEINLNELQPMLNGPATPDRSHAISEFSKSIKENDWAPELSAALIGSCTNSSYQDYTCAASIAKQAIAHGLKCKSDLFISPGSEQIFATMKRDGLLDIFEQVGGKVLANACGPCIGQWNRTDKQGEKNSIVSSFNRNFSGRNDGNLLTSHFLTSPMLVMAMAFAGRIDFNPITDSLVGSDGKEFKFQPPQSDELPAKGYEKVDGGYLEPLTNIEQAKKIDVNVDPKSNRLQILEPWNAWDGKDFIELPVLIKVAGKCTTDHISPAGKWLNYKGHLENISNCTLIGAVNAMNGKINKVKNVFNGKEDTVPEVAKSYQREYKKSWIAIGDSNYGEGSAREHAALQPRFLGCVAVITRSFARIHETNLKKQGILPLTFVNPNDYDLINPETDLISVIGVENLKPNSPLTLTVKGKPEIQIPLQHTMNNAQIEWFRAGSALNWIRDQLNK